MCLHYSMLQALCSRLQPLHSALTGAACCITPVPGHAGDLAKKKIFPSLFALYHDGMLPKDFTVYGYARSKMTEEDFRHSIEGNLPCRLADGAKCGESMANFLRHCQYQQGQYASNEDFSKLSDRMHQTEQAKTYPQNAQVSIMTAQAGLFLWGVLRCFFYRRDRGSRHFLAEAFCLHAAEASRELARHMPATGSTAVL